MKQRFRQEIYITNTETMIWFLILIEVDIKDIPLRIYIIPLPELDHRFKIYPYIKN
jgi:hypothetical protein